MEQVYTGLSAKLAYGEPGRVSARSSRASQALFRAASENQPATQFAQRTYETRHATNREKALVCACDMSSFPLDFAIRCAGLRQKT
jgi:hypothetical protein